MDCYRRFAHCYAQHAQGYYRKTGHRFTGLDKQGFSTGIAEAATRSKPCNRWSERGKVSISMSSRPFSPAWTDEPANADTEQAREKILEEVDDILPGDTKHTKAPIPTNTQIKRKRSPSTQRPSKIAKSTHPTSEAIPPTTPPVPGADASEPVDTTMTDSPITTSEPLKSEPSPVPDDAAQQSVPSPAFYDINAEVDEAMETAAEARKRQRKRDEGEIEKRKRESTGSMTALSVHADAVAGSIRTSVAKRRRISPEVDISGSSRGRRKRGVEEYSLEKELLSTPKQVRAGP